MDPGRPIRALLAYHVATGAAGAVLVGGAWGFDRGLSFGAGVLITLVAVGALGWAGWRTFTQKSVAWTVIIIISKYAILLSSVVYLTHAAWFDPVAGGLGLASFIVPALGWAIFYRESEIPRG